MFHPSSPPPISLRELIDAELDFLRQDLRHLIYPLNYSANTTDLIARQEKFVDLYEKEWDRWVQEIIYNNLQMEEEFEDKILLLRSLFARFIGNSGYDARTRTLLLALSQRKGISEETFVVEVENWTLEKLTKSREEEDSSEEEANCAIERSLSRCEVVDQDVNRPSASRTWSKKRWFYATAGVVVGAAACSLTAGLAAPIFLPAILSAAGITGAAFLAGSGGVALMATLFGIAGAGMASYRVSRRFADLKDFKFIPLKDADRNRNLRICITISGWIKSDKDFTGPWIESYLRNEAVDSVMQSEVYCLAFEKDIMISLGRAMQDFITSSAVTVAASQFIKYTVTAAASSALLFPVAVLQAGDLVDNPWTLGLDRARKAGKALAEALRKGAQGRRPVTLVGYSLGALVIFTCLQELARISLNEEASNLIMSASVVSNQSSEDLSTAASDSSSSTEYPTSQQKQSVFGIIENVLLMGLPTHLPAPSVWNQLRLLVSGRFIHCYSQTDWVLKFLYRTSSPTALDIAGLGPIEDVPSIENVDLSQLVHGHSDYQSKAAEIISLVNL